MLKPTEIRRHSHTAQAAYHDLVSLLLDESVADIRGTAILKQRGERRYWYDHYRVGRSTRERYLGEDHAGLRERIDRHEQLKQGRDARRKERTRLVRLLRSERYAGLDTASGSLLSAFARAGVFRLGGVLLGTSAFILYEGELGLRLGHEETARTNDIDIASFDRLALGLGDGLQDNLADVLAGFDFAPLPDLDPAKTWRWRQSERQSLVEFLTPSFRDDEGVQNLDALGVSARALHHLDYVIGKPIAAAAVYRDGVLVRIPRPERYAVHKLIVADRRRDGPASLKARKDLMQARILIAALAEDRPGELLEAYEEAISRGSQWVRRIDASLARAPDIAERLEAVRQGR